MSVRLLCVGDIVGTPGRRALTEAIPLLIERHGIDCVIVNAENAASGSGLTPTMYQKVLDAGADLVTLGDHVYRRKEIIATLETSDRIVRPANLPTTAPGKEFAVCQSRSGQQVAIISVLGRMFMKLPTSCPFATIDRVLRLIPKDVKVILVEIHAEATSEKVAIGWHLDGRVTCVFGTHTHVPTADERVLPKGTAYISDLGMTGPYDSVLGRLKERVIGTMMSGVPSPFDVAHDDVRLCGILVDVDPRSGRATAIERVRFDVGA